MAVSQISICNSALIKVGADPIQSITQDTRSATLLDALWDQVRDTVMRAHPWNFAIMRATLAPTSDEPAWGYEYEYDLPSDCLRFLSIDPDDTEHVIEGNRKLRCDESELDVLYIYRNTDESSWDACFAEALAWKLATEISYALTQSLALKQECELQYRKVLAEARSMDGAEGTLFGLVADDWTNERL